MENINSNISANELAQLAIMEVQNLTSNNEFIMRDLFVGYQWDAVDKNVRLRAGKIFYEKLMKPIRVQELGLTEQKQQIYKLN